MEEIEDLANDMNDKIGRYKIAFTLSPDLLQKRINIINNLDWKSIPYGNKDKNNLPNKRGIYAFVIYTKSNILPSHSYVMYIGIAGRRSNRSIKERYKDYLSISQVRKRANITRLIGMWNKVLHFTYATIDDNMTSEVLEELEKQLNDALLPPFSKGDLSGGLKKMVGAF
jgi:hypothetical protein